MKIYAINGSPRKKNNTATLLGKVLEGAGAAAGRLGMDVEAELIHLYDYRYTGCRSCFACKLIGGKSYGRCAVKDDLADVLEKLRDADALVFGSPIYFSEVTGELRSFLERLLFPNLVYDANYSSLAVKKPATAFVYTMNVSEEQYRQLNYRDGLARTEFFVEKLFSKPLLLHAFDTYQFSDYSRYKNDVFSEEHKAKVRAEQFPADCRRAFELGEALVTPPHAGKA